MSSRDQKNLPGFENTPTSDYKRRCGEARWFYVVNLRNQEMIALSDDGSYTWIPHDTQRLVPHLFNRRRKAQVFAKSYRHACVARWPFPV